MTEPTAPTRPARVLVVDDEPSIRLLFSAWVGSLGHSAMAAANADEALAHCQQNHVDLVLCDIRMPGHDGLWLIERLRHDYPAIPIAVVTGVVDLPPFVTLQAGVLGYLVKPFRRDELEQMIHLAMAPERPWLTDPPGPEDAVWSALDAMDTAMTDTPTPVAGDDPKPR